VIFASLPNLLTIRQQINYGDEPADLKEDELP
jgi:hypothetical protein